jgi:hypothetical protein
MDHCQLREIINRNFQEFTRKVLDETHAPELENLRNTMYYGNQAYTDPICSIAHLLLHMENVIANHIHPKHTSHETVTMSHCGQMIRIDRNIAPLISEIWRLGLETINSCENNVPENYMWIEFANEASLRQLLDIVLINESGQSELYKKISDYPYSYPNAWQITIHYDTESDIDVSTSECSDMKVYQRELEGSFSVRFPVTDYDTVLEKFFQYSDQ